MTQRLSLWNAISLAVMLSANVLANTVPIGGRTTGEISDAYAHLFAPTGFTFAIWGLIYVLLLAWVVDQLVRAWSGSSTPSLPLQAVGMLFVLSSLANTGWILAWHHDYMFLSALLTLALLLTVFCIYTLVHRPRLPFRSPAERWLTQLPFRVYAGWVSVALMANITVVLVDRGWQGWGLSEVFWTVTMLVTAASLALVVLVRRQDPVFALVIAWALGGIAFRHLRSLPPLPQLGGVALAGAAIILLAALMHLAVRHGTPATRAKTG